MELIRLSGPAPDVGELLREAMLSQRFADVALCCPGGQKFLAHRLVLSAASPYLQVSNPRPAGEILAERAGLSRARCACAGAFGGRCVVYEECACAIGEGFARRIVLH